MKKHLIGAGLLCLLVISQSATAKTLEEVLKEKGVITEEDYKAVIKSRQLDYKPGKGFSLNSPDEHFQLNFGGYLQTRYSFNDLDANSATTPDISKFEMKALKLTFNGYAYNKDLTYAIQTNFVQGGSSKIIEQGYMNYRLRDEVQILAGQTNVPFGRQWLNSTTGLEFVDRAYASDAFRPGYDTGLKLHGKIADSLLTYEVGAYGGVGQSTYRATNNNALAARVTVNPFGPMTYSEGELEQSTKPLLSLGGNYYLNTLKATYTPASGTIKASTVLETNNVDLAASTGWLGKGLSKFTSTENLDISSFGFDVAFKWNGVSLQSEYLRGEAYGKTSHKNLRAEGYYAQVGYFVIPKTVELATRYSFVDLDRDAHNKHIADITGAVSWYISKHNLKIQSDVTNSYNKQASTHDLLYRLQAQLMF
ncbi:MAG: porin [Geobacteraceae bacterium]|nr:porin [Geobacteraceae bacterium]